jgi:hypothetical protein
MKAIKLQKAFILFQFKQQININKNVEIQFSSSNFIFQYIDPRSAIFYFKLMLSVRKTISLNIRSNLWQRVNNLGVKKEKTKAFKIFSEFYCGAAPTPLTHRV